MNLHLRSWDCSSFRWHRSGQKLQSQTTWGPPAPSSPRSRSPRRDGSSYLTGTSDSFAVDQFGTPEARIFLSEIRSRWIARLAAHLEWPVGARHVPRAGRHRRRRARYMLPASRYNDDATPSSEGHCGRVLVWERVWAAARRRVEPAWHRRRERSVYIAGNTRASGPSSAGLFVVKFNAAGALLWQKTGTTHSVRRWPLRGRQRVLPLRRPRALVRSASLTSTR